MESPGGRGTQGPLEMRASPVSLVPLERREKLATRETQGLTVPPETGAALGKGDHGGRQACGALEETRAKLDPKVTRDEKALSASPETRVRLAPSDLKDTEEMRALRGWRAPEEPQGLQDPPETPGSWAQGEKTAPPETAPRASPASRAIQAAGALLG